ncbi:MAG: 4Fe-4S dicluster domain-containing protein [Promethearchaeota archaeon]
MKKKILLKENVGKMIEALKEEYTIFAPVIEEGNVFFKKVSSGEEIALDYLNSKIPPKEVLFPKVETLFEFKQVGDDIEIIPPKLEEKKTIIFGIRPCDAHSLKLMHMFFGFGEFKDELFLKKWDNTILMGMACNHPRSTCFCTSLQGHPFNKEDVDIFLVDLGKRYLVEGITEKGNEVLGKIKGLGHAREEDLEKALELSTQAELAMKPLVDLGKVPEILNSNFDHPIWKEISYTCLSCGSCVFLCPTCHCFDVIDENDQYNKRGRRIRIWDTCQFKLYTQHTSGHNPRPTKVERYRNRILHKYCYYPNNYDLIGCVGCGRCIEYCPVNNDIREIIKSFIEIEKKKEKEEISIAE